MPLGQKTRSIVNRPFCILFAPPLTVVLNCWFLNPTMAGHSPVLTLQF
jgi:hypothetical protein